MRTPSHDEPFRRLKNCDPAHGFHPHTEPLHAKVHARTHTPDQLAARRPKVWLAVAASAAAVMVGAAGFVLGARTTPAGTHVATTPHGVGAPMLDAQARATDPAPQARPEVAWAPHGADIAVMPTWGRTVFTASLPSSSGRPSPREVWVYDARTTTKEVQALARTLGVNGKVHHSHGTYTVGTHDTGPVLTVSTHAQGHLYFHDPRADTFQCDPSGACTERQLDPPPDPREARAVAVKVLEGLGVDITTLDFQVPYQGVDHTTVQARHKFDADPTGYAWSVSVTSTGISSIWGTTGTLVSLGDYRLIDATEAVDRLNDARFGPGVPTHPRGEVMPAGDARADAVTHDAAPALLGAGDESLPGAGGKLSWHVETVHITSAELGVHTWHLTSGHVVIAPTWHLSAKDGRTWSVIALTQDHLAF